jgi:hypothetical protein
MNILKTLRNGVHARDDDGDSPEPSPPDHSPPLTERYESSDPAVARDYEQPLVAGNGLPKPRRGLKSRP